MPAPTAILGGQVVRTGKKEKKEDERTLKLAPYLRAGELPPFPRPLQRSYLVPDDEWGMMLNDNLGDCTCATAGHSIQIASAIASGGKNIITVTDQDIADVYWATGDEDDGRFCIDVLKHWVNKGIGGHKALAFAELDLNDLFHQFRHGMHLFGFVYLGIGLPVTAQKQKEWRYVPDDPDNEPWSWGGHAIHTSDYEREDAEGVSWGRPVKLGWEFIKHYVDEAYVVLLPEILNASGRNIDGLDVDALLGDVEILRNR